MTFHGIIPAVMTPFDADDSIDTDALGRNVEHVLDGGVHGIVGTGTMGESGSLTRAERRQVLETLVSVVDSRVPVIAGIAAQNPVVASEYIEDAKAAGVAGFMVLPPLLYDGGYEEIAAYFKAICAAAELPVIAYNNPKAAGYDVDAATLVRLKADVDGIVGIKECSSDVRRIPEILNGSGGTLDVLVGGDDWALEGLAVGAQGWISGVADVFPRECVELYDLVVAGDLAPARELYGRLLPLARFDMTMKLVQYYKAGLDEVGLTGGPSRAPRLPLLPEEQRELLDAVALVRDRVAA